MNLSAPKTTTFYVALALGILGFLGFLIPPRIYHHTRFLVCVGWVCCARCCSSRPEPVN